MANNEADMKNKNLGTKGQNKTISQKDGNRGKQLNPNNNEKVNDKPEEKI